MEEEEPLKWLAELFSKHANKKPTERIGFMTDEEVKQWNGLSELAGKITNLTHELETRRRAFWSNIRNTNRDIRQNSIHQRIRPKYLHAEIRRRYAKI